LNIKIVHHQCTQKNKESSRDQKQKNKEEGRGRGD